MKTVSTFITIMLFCMSVFAQKGTEKSTQSVSNEPTAEMRTQMVQMHEQMAECLKSDKSFADCHNSMMNNCPMAKDGNCPMMGSKMPMMHHKMMHGQHGMPGCCGPGTKQNQDPSQKK